MKLGIVGGGAMGEAILASLIKRGVLAAADISVAERFPDRAAALAKEYGVETGPEPATAARDADYLILAVKPQDFEEAAASLAGKVGRKCTVISIMAGVTLDSLTSTLRHSAVVRSIPNTPAQVGHGMTVWTCGREVDDAAREDVRRIFAAMGEEAFVPSESYIDMATALSGSGPAYVFLFIEALTDAGVHVGMPRELAARVALQTVAGSALFAQESGRHPVELRNQVTSPGGTTAEGLRALEAGGFRAAVTDAVLATYNRAKTLGKGESGK
jgi:pyrroline-5-carboxylate reductase